MDRKHPADDDLFLLHILVAIQVELGLQLARDLCGSKSVKVEKDT